MWSVGRWVSELVFGGSVEDLLVSWWLVVSCRWVGRGPVGESVFGGLVEDLLVGR